MNRTRATNVATMHTVRAGTNDSQKENEDGKETQTNGKQMNNDMDGQFDNRLLTTETTLVNTASARTCRTFGLLGLF